MSESAGAGASASAASPVTNSAPQAGEGAKAPSSPAPDFRGTKHKVKVDGREAEVDYERLVRGFQLEQASHGRMQQAAETAKKAEKALKLEEAISKGDRQALKKLLSPDQFRQFAEEYLYEEYQYENLPEGEKRRLAAEKRAQELEEQLKEHTDKATKAEREAAMADAAVQVDNEIAEVLSQLGRSPDKYLVAAIVDEMIATYEVSKGEKKLTAKEAMAKAQRRINGDVESYLMGMKPEDFVKTVPPQYMDAVRKHLVAQATEGQPRRANTATSDRQPSQPRNTGDKPKNIDSWFQEQEQRFKRRSS